MKKQIYILLLTMLIVVAGCAQQTSIEPGVFNEELSQTSFEKDMLTYNLSFQKPTPCHSLNVTRTFDEGVLTLNVETVYKAQTGEVCAQVIEFENVVGEFEDENLEELQVFLDNTQIYTATY